MANCLIYCKYILPFYQVLSRWDNCNLLCDRLSLWYLYDSQWHKLRQHYEIMTQD